LEKYVGLAIKILHEDNEVYISGIGEKTIGWAVRVALNICENWQTKNKISLAQNIQISIVQNSQDLGSPTSSMSSKIEESKFDSLKKNRRLPYINILLKN
jgi:hypothetical protein